MDHYLQKEKETSAAVDKILAKYLSGMEKTTAYFPTKRMGHPRLRDLSIRLGYELVGGKNWQETIPIAAAFELENCSSYVINWIFDEKGGPKTKSEINDLIIAGMRLRELADKVLRDAKLESFLVCIHDINFNGYAGQYADLNVIKVEHLSQYQNPDDFMKAYEERCRQLTGIFYGHSLSAGSRLLGKPSPELYAIGERFGMALQAANDLGDFAIIHKGQAVLEKPYQDQFSDLRQGKLTLPLYWALMRGTRNEKKVIKNLIGKKKISLNEMKRVFRILERTKALDDCLDYLKSSRYATKKMLYDHFPKSSQRDQIAEMFRIIVSNKFTFAIKKSKLKK